MAPLAATAVGLVVGIVLVGGAGYAASLAFKSADATPRPSMLTHTVQRGEMLVTVTEDGNVESAKNVEIKCQVAGGSSILIDRQGRQRCETGRETGRIGCFSLEDQINAQKITYEKARSAHGPGREGFSSRRDLREGVPGRNLQEGTPRRRGADHHRLGEPAHLARTCCSTRSGCSARATSARWSWRGSSFRSSGLSWNWIPPARPKTSWRTLPKSKRWRTCEARWKRPRPRWSPRRRPLHLEESRLKRLEDQKGYCVISAPQDGMVVYANEQTGGMRGGQQGPQIEEGATVRERQTILRLPDLSQMQVKVTVHETKVEQLRHRHAGPDSDPGPRTAGRGAVRLPISPSRPASSRPASRSTARSSRSTASRPVCGPA